MIDAFRTNQIGDALVQAYLDAKGDSSAARGIGESGDAYGVAQQAQNVLAYLIATDDSQVQADLTRTFLDMQRDFTTLEVVGDRFRSAVNRLNTHVKKGGVSGVTTLDTWLTYLNTGTSPKWQGLWAPEWYDVYNAVKGGTVRPAVNNLYFEVLQGATYANGLRKLVVGTGETAGFAIDSAKYCGGYPRLKVSSFAGTSDTVTVTGTAYDPATKTTSASKTWTATVGDDGYFYLAPGGGSAAPTGSLIVAVSGITAGGNITSGTTIVVEAERPYVRSATAQSGSDDTITLDASASSEDDVYAGLVIQQAADNYDPRTILSYVGSTKVATVDSNWTSNPSTTPFRIMRTKPA